MRGEGDDPAGRCVRSPKANARIIRAKGSRRERDYALLASRHRRFRTAVEQLANQTTSPAPE